MSDALLALGDRPFVRLTTFRRSGEGVGTTVWVARDGDDLLVTTPPGSGKVKRIRNDRHVTLEPSTRFGRAPREATGTPAVALPAMAIVDTDPATPDRLQRIFRAKYGLQFLIFLAVERRLGRDPRPRTVLRITDRTD